MIPKSGYRFSDEIMLQQKAPNEKGGRLSPPALFVAPLRGAAARIGYGQ
jgi:hypothetical protein